MRGPTLILNVALSFTLNFFFFYQHSSIYTVCVCKNPPCVLWGQEKLHSGHDQQVLKIFLLVVGCDDSRVREGGVVVQDYIIHTEASSPELSEGHSPKRM